MDFKEAETAREAFFKTYFGIAEWHNTQKQRMYESCFETYWRHEAEKGIFSEKRPAVRTLGGRLRVWPVVTDRARTTGREYLRKAGGLNEMFNTPDQGTGADMLKYAMCLLYKEFFEREWEDVKIVMCVHDEIIVEAPIGIAEEVKNVVEGVMLKAAKTFLPDVPVECEIAVADSWAEK